MDGIIQEVNTELQEHPEIVCDDPFENGWIYRILFCHTDYYFWRFRNLAGSLRYA